MKKKKKKVVVVERWDLMRAFIKDCLKKTDDFEVESFFTDAASAYEHIKKSGTDLLILELPSEDSEGEIIKTYEIKKGLPDINIIFTTLTSSAKLEDEAEKTGTGYIWQKEFSEESFRNIINRI